jgi:hypothetical protein
MLPRRERKGHVVAIPDLGLITGTWSRIEVGARWCAQPAPAAVMRRASSRCSTPTLQPTVLSR